MHLLVKYTYFWGSFLQQSEVEFSFCCQLMKCLHLGVLNCSPVPESIKHTSHQRLGICLINVSDQSQSLLKFVPSKRNFFVQIWWPICFKVLRTISSKWRERKFRNYSIVRILNDHRLSSLNTVKEICRWTVFFFLNARLCILLKNKWYAPYGEN